LNPSRELDRRIHKEKKEINEHTLLTYLSLCEIKGISKEWITTIKRYLTHYLDYIKWNITQEKTIDYLKSLLNQQSISHYRKQFYQIRKYLTYLDIDWVQNLKPPSEPDYIPNRVSLDDIQNILTHFRENQYFKQIKAIILLGASSGMRAEELYQLNQNDIDIENRIVHINHNPNNGQTTKTKKSRVSFFNVETQNAMSEYITYFNKDACLKRLFSKTHIQRAFKSKSIKVKDLRKFFSQEWDRRGGPTSIKKILMGHSLRNDVDLMHYNAQSEEDLKKIYNKVMNSNLINEEK